MFDTHAHLNFPDYNKDREDVIKKCLSKGVFVVNVGTSYKESKEVINIANNYSEGIYASVGLHPLYIEEGFVYDDYKNLAKEKKVVAIGETGLDYKYIKNKEDKENIAEKQADIFKKHIKLSQELDLPLILHCRMAHKELISTLKEEVINSKKIKGVLHCFSSSARDAEEYLELGLYIGINGIIFKMNLEKAVKSVPLERIVLETDCPFLSPMPDIKRNEPLFLDIIASKIAKIKGESKEKVIITTTKNAKELFEV